MEHPAKISSTPSQPLRIAIRLLAASSFPVLAMLYLALFAAFGTESPFFPSLLASRGLSSANIGILLAAGTAVRLSTGPFVGIVADRFGTRSVLGLAAFGAGAIFLLYAWSSGFWLLLAVSMIHSVAIAPLNPLADTLALRACAREGLFPYGWVRGLGSAGFICGTMASGLFVAIFGIDSILVVAAVLFVMMIPPLPWLEPSATATAELARGGIAELFAIPVFRRLLFVAGLVIGSHAMSDAFAVIRWRGAGVNASAIGFLWSEAVTSELVVFFLLGPWLLGRLGPGRCAAVAAIAGAIRWALDALTTNVVALVAVQSLHGLTFALMHLACMQVIGAVAPDKLLATAQTLYGTLCLGIASATLTLLSGELYGVFGAKAFWIMSALCIMALPLTTGISTRDLHRVADAASNQP